MNAGFWGDTLGSLSGTFDGIKQFGEGFAQSFGMNPPGYHTNLQMFNGTTNTTSCTNGARGQVPVRVELKRVKKYQGVTFHQGTIKTIDGILPGQDTGNGGLSDIGLYLEIVLSANGNELFSDTIASQEPQYHNCQDTYVYNFYSNSSGTHSEYLGWNKGTTNDFYGQIYNASPEPCYLRYTYNNEVFTVLLEPNTFNFLQSDSSNPQSMRPGELVFTFANGTTQTIGLTKTWIADKAGKTTTPMQCHYEIYKSGNTTEVFQTGLGIGNYTPSVNGDLRMIGPVTCSIWNKSAAQATSYPEYVPIQSKSRTVWFGYGTPGWADITTGVQNILIGTIPYGEAVTFKFIRPTVYPYQVTLPSGLKLATQKLSEYDMLPIKNVNQDPAMSNITQGFYRRVGRILQWGCQMPSVLNTQQVNEEDLLGQLLQPVNLKIYMDALAPTTAKANLYVFSLDTADEKKARRYMEKLITGELSYDYKSQNEFVKKLQNDIASIKNKSTLSQQTKSDLMSGSLKTDYGLVYDNETGVTGHPLIIDVFIPYGNGLGPYYYTVEPPIQSVSLAKLSWLQTYLKSQFFSTTDQTSAFAAILQQWVQKIYASDTVTEGVQAVYPDIVSFLQQNGVDELFNVNQGVVDRKSMGSLGNYVISTLLIGPMSIINQPLYWNSGVSSYVISGTSQPTTYDPTTNSLVSAWKPAKTTVLNKPAGSLLKVADNKLNLGVSYQYPVSNN